MKLARRNFVGGSIAAVAFGGCARASLAGESYRNEIEGYGPLVADPAGYFDLPAGFAYSVLARAGETMGDGFILPDNFDGMGCIPIDAHRAALVRNHELSPGKAHKGAAAGQPELENRLSRAAFYGRDADGTVLPGGTTTAIWDSRSGRIEQQFLSLAGTSTNCAGGITPWGSWLSCEETIIASPQVEKSHGWVFEVPAAQRGLVDPVPLKAMGRFRHEAAAVDPVSGVVYMTEDREDGLFYRFLPSVRNQLAAGGKLQVLALSNGLTDTRNWKSPEFAPGATMRGHWLDIDDVHSPQDDLRQRGHVRGAALFARGEGIHTGVAADGSCELFFTCTSGGAKRQGQIFRFKPTSHDLGELQLFTESTDTRVINYADNLVVAPWGHLIVCEDRAGTQTNHLRGIAPNGKVYTIARLNADTELAGACFSPDGKVLFVNAYSPGRTLAITGPWRSRLSMQLTGS